MVPTACTLLHTLTHTMLMRHGPHAQASWTLTFARPLP